MIKKAFLALLLISLGEGLLAKVLQFIISVPYAEIKIVASIIVIFLMGWWLVIVPKRIWPHHFL